MEQNAHRLRIALATLEINLRGRGINSLKPISQQLAWEMADFARDAWTGQPNSLLDDAVGKNPAEQ